MLTLLLKELFENVEWILPELDRGAQLVIAALGISKPPGRVQGLTA